MRTVRRTMPEHTVQTGGLYFYYSYGRVERGIWTKMYVNNTNTGWVYQSIQILIVILK